VTKHDEVRRILHESGFKFADGRLALEMTDEEVEQWLVHFSAAMSDFARQFTIALRSLAELIVKTIEPLKELNQLLDEEESS